jgi:hypothetical protein
LITGEFPASFRRFALSAAQTSPIAHSTGLVESGIPPDVAHLTGLVESGIHPDPRPYVPRSTGLVESRVPSDVTRRAGLVESGIHPDPVPGVPHPTGLIESGIPRVTRTGQHGEHPNDNNKRQQKNGCRSRPMVSILFHVLSPFNG